ncbi:hypothetical protein [Bacteroides sp.]|uniref:hypothetical protein n=1 Tax=Bacteroides sp. TaxID=29523 RepID=UPI00262DAC20|nr:hypothetical protein [Bacteroides sp.]
MANEQIYKKGDKVWVEEPTSTGSSQKCPALIVSTKIDTLSFNRENYIAIRYLNRNDTTAYQCIPENWIMGHIEEDTNKFQ